MCTNRSFLQILLHNRPKCDKHSKYKPLNKKARKNNCNYFLCPIDSLSLNTKYKQFYRSSKNFARSKMKRAKFEFPTNIFFFLISRSTATAEKHVK